VRRETEEVYRGGLTGDDAVAVDDILRVAMPRAARFYDNLSLTETDTSVQIGDVTLRKLNTGAPGVPSASSQLVLTDRTKKVLYQLAKAIDCGENALLIGERAAGKTAMAKMLAGLLGQPYHRQLISASTDTSQLIGAYDDRGWKDGPLLRAARPDGVPGMLLLDEMNLGSSSLLERLNPVLDDERKVVLAEKEGEEVKLHDDFHFVAAMNPPTRAYGGRHKLSKALQNRLTPIWVDDLDAPDEQRTILRALAERRNVNARVADAFVELHHFIRDGYAEGSLGKSLRRGEAPVLSMRQLMNALDAQVSAEALGMEPGAAFALAVDFTYAAIASDDDRDAIMAKMEALRA
jgi:midasin (ATPase involved in ribosome maturation)